MVEYNIIKRIIIIERGMLMKVREIRDVLGARIACGEEYLDREVQTACGSDMMSDVLAFLKEQAVLLTGLCTLLV